MHVADKLRRLIDGGRVKEKPLETVAVRVTTHFRALILSQPSYQIREGSHINISVTAPGATLALGLMYLKTHNEAVEAQLRIPDTQVTYWVSSSCSLMFHISFSLITCDQIFCCCAQYRRT